MQHTIKQWWHNIPSKGGLIGAIIGAVASSGIHHAGDKPVKLLGKTVLFTGAGFLAGQWIEKFLTRNKTRY